MCECGNTPLTEEANECSAYESECHHPIYSGKLNKELDVIEEIHKLYWVSVSENFFDLNKYAGEGNIGHMLEQVKFHRGQAIR